MSVRSGLQMFKAVNEKSGLELIIHRNWVLSQKKIRETVFNIIPNKPESLHEWIGNCTHYKPGKTWKEDESRFMNDFTRAVLLQVTHAVLHLHRCGIVCGNVDASEIYFTQDRRNLVYRELERKGIDGTKMSSSGTSEDRSKPTHTEQKTNQSKGNVSTESGIRSLGKLFYYVLSGSEDDKKGSLLCKEPKIAKDLIEKMLKNYVTLEDVLKHQFFWSANKKISFICEIVDYIKNEEKERDDEEMKMKGDGKLVLQKEGSENMNWIESLRLTEKELRSNRRERKKHGSRKGDEKVCSYKRIQDKHCSRIGIRDDTIIKLTETCNAGEKKKKPTETKKEDDKIKNKLTGTKNGHTKKKKSLYEKNSIYELLRFIRNRRAHYLEHDKIVRGIFKNCTDGFWEFFSDRFPWLFWHSYSKMKDRLEKGSGHDSYLVDLAENRDIPSLPKNNDEQQKEKKNVNMNPSSSSNCHSNSETHKRKISETSGSETGKRKKT